MGYFAGRRSRKAAREVLRQAKYLRNMSGDLLADSELAKLKSLEDDLKEKMRQRDLALLDQASSRLGSLVLHLMPTKDHIVLRENLEVIVVAVIVAMAVRTYFLQPFKIPTGSMQPTLYGITSRPLAKPGLLDKMPLKLAKWIVTGEWYKEIRAKTGGTLTDSGFLRHNGAAPPVALVGNTPHKIPRDARLNYGTGQYVHEGALLWSGIVKAGDHVFVNKVSWNFRRPRRGEIMVFQTDGIPISPERPLPRGTHYIKRMAGLPRERVQIFPPHLLIDGSRVEDTPTIVRIAEKERGYDGYKLALRDPRARLRSPGDAVDLGPGQYFALGDNTRSSKDGRYWGFVPQENLVGPAIIVYWPFWDPAPETGRQRWGLAD